MWITDESRLPHSVYSRGCSFRALAQGQQLEFGEQTKICSDLLENASGFPQSFHLWAGGAGSCRICMRFRPREGWRAASHLLSRGKPSGRFLTPSGIRCGQNSITFSRSTPREEEKVFSSCIVGARKRNQGLMKMVRFFQKGWRAFTVGVVACCGEAAGGLEGGSAERIQVGKRVRQWMGIAVTPGDQGAGEGLTPSPGAPLPRRVQAQRGFTGLQSREEPETSS